MSSEATTKYTDPQPDDQWVRKFKGELDVGQEVSQTMSIDQHQAKPELGSISDLQEQEEDDESPNQSRNEEAEGE